jgi:hypothetical protein
MHLHRIGFSAILKQTNTSDLFFLVHPKLSCIHPLIFTQTLLTLIQDRQILIAEFWSFIYRNKSESTKLPYASMLIEDQNTF